MKQTLSLVAFCALAAFGLSTGQNDEVVWKDWGAEPMANPKFMVETLRLATPGEQHAAFAKAAGEYTVEGRHWVGPDSEPEPLSATSSMRTELGGRLLIERFESDFAGMPFEGMLVMGYDNLAQEYFAHWYDTMSTWGSEMRGRAQSDGRLTWTGTMRDVMTPQGRPVRSEDEHHEDGSLTVKMYDTLPERGEFLKMELTYRPKS